MKSDWDRFRRLSPEERRNLLVQTRGWEYFSGNFDNLSSVMTENSVGMFPVPLGIVPEILINGKSYTVPMATEEPSVIAAASYAAALIGKHGGFRAEAPATVMTEQIFLSNAGPDDFEKARKLDKELTALVSGDLAGMVKRGGGLVKTEFQYIPQKRTMKISLHINVCDALGANVMNSAGEKGGKFLAEKLGVKLLMAILSNSGEERVCTASFELPQEMLARGGKSGKEVSEALILAAELASVDPERAVTHNKGIMNGISAFALATGNDTRAIESAVHLHASAGGSYSALSSYLIKEGKLHGEISIPVPLALKGGSTEFHPLAARNLELTGTKSAAELGMLAASIGLAQNFAALFALVSEGIQKGHMALHAGKKAFALGLNGKKAEAFVKKMQAEPEKSAEQILREVSDG